MKNNIGHYALLGLGVLTAAFGIFTSQWTPAIFDYILKSVSASLAIFYFPPNLYLGGSILLLG
jgi:hypothetical protein